MNPIAWLCGFCIGYFGFQAFINYCERQFVKGTISACVTAVALLLLIFG